MRCVWLVIIACCGCLGVCLRGFGFRDCLDSVVGDVLVLVVGYGYWFRLDRGFVAVGLFVGALIVFW